MNNPLEKKDHTLLITGIVIGAIAAGAATYLLYTESGNELREKLMGQLSGLFNTSEETPEPAHESQ